MRNVWLLSAGITAAIISSSASASADVCPADAVYIRGSSASQKIVEAVAKVAALQSVKIVYSKDGSSCKGGVYEAVTPTTAETRTEPATALTSFDSNQAGTCDLQANRAADIGVSDVYPTSCAGIGTLGTAVLPSDVADILGPVQAFTLAVHDDASFPVAINAEAAFNTFGIIGRSGDATFGVDPWTTPADIYGRGEDSGTWQTWARNLGLPTTKVVTAAVKGSAGDVLSAINSGNRNSVIGIIALNDIVTPSGGEAPKVRPLAFQQRGQKFAFYPNSTSTASDMINVRDGHYAVWANLHFLARKTGGSFPANVQTVLNLLEGKDAASAIAKVRAVPKCAMQVQRGSDAGDFSAYKPEKPCGCFFEQESSGTAPATCTACTDENAATTCGSDKQCVYGFCEAK